MTATTHRLGGIAVGIAAIQLLPADIGLGCQTVLIGSSLLGCLIPDIDNARSSISCRFRIISIFVSIGQAVTRVFASVLPRKQEKYVRQIVGHRGISHSLLMVILSFSMIYAVGVYCSSQEIKIGALGVAIGIFSHVFLDMLANGVPLFAPFSMRRVTLGHIKTGGIGEWIFRTAAVAFMTSVVLNIF